MSVGQAHLRVLLFSQIDWRPLYRHTGTNASYRVQVFISDGVEGKGDISDCRQLLCFAP